MRKLLLTGAAFGCLMMGPLSAQADSPIYSFTGSGTTGSLVGSNEVWQYGGLPPPSTSDVNWGSPGIGANGQGLGGASYGETISATDFQITFAKPLDAGQINNSGGCGGGNNGGTAFCSFVGANPVQWPATFGTDSITFDAPPGVSLKQGGAYFVNIFLSPGEGVSGGSFSGDWSAEGTAVPEPASLSMLGAGLLSFGWFRRRRR